MIKNLVLISGMDGTNILFQPFIKVLATYSVNVLVYDMNADENQDVFYQANLLKQAIKQKFSQQRITIVAESYGGLLAYELLRHPKIVPEMNADKIYIDKIYFIGGFLSCPSYAAKWAYAIVPSLMGLLQSCPNWLRTFMIGRFAFCGFFDDVMMRLFRTVLWQLNQPALKTMFKQRLKNIAKSSFVNPCEKISTPCVYVASSCDYLVPHHNIHHFEQAFDDLTVVYLEGSHFLLSYQAKAVASIILE